MDNFDLFDIIHLPVAIKISHISAVTVIFCRHFSSNFHHSVTLLQQLAPILAAIQDVLKMYRRIKLLVATVMGIAAKDH